MTELVDVETGRKAAMTQQPAGEPWVRLEDVTFSYPNGTQAIGRTSFEIAEGSIVGIVGPSGCGKSSLLSLLSGINEPTSGRVVFSDDPAGSGARRHPMSMVFQKDTLLPWLTVEQNVQMYQRFTKRRRRGSNDLVDELLELASLTAFRGAYPYQLSGGMRRRVAFLTAMAAEPRGLLLDEPTRLAIHQDVLDIIRRQGTTVVLVTHDLAEAISLCDEVLILTNRPGTIAARHEVPFGRERDVLGLRQRADFLELTGELWTELSRQIKRSQEQLLEQEQEAIS